MGQKTVEGSPTREEPDHDRNLTQARQSHRQHNKFKVLIVMSIAVVLGAFGDICLSKGMKTVAGTDHSSLLQAFIAAVSNIYVMAGVVLLASFLILYLACLSWEDLSYVLPLTAADYVLVTLLAFIVLHENVSPMRGVGSLMVAGGIALVARS